MVKIRLMFSGVPGATERVIRATPINDTPEAAEAAAQAALQEAHTQIGALLVTPVLVSATSETAGASEPNTGGEMPVTSAPAPKKKGKK